MSFHGSQGKGEEIQDIETWTIKSLVQSVFPHSKNKHRESKISEFMLKFYRVTKAQLQLFSAGKLKLYLHRRGRTEERQERRQVCCSGGILTGTAWGLVPGHCGALKSGRELPGAAV